MNNALICVNGGEKGSCTQGVLVRVGLSDLPGSQVCYLAVEHRLHLVCTTAVAVSHSDDGGIP